MDAEPDGGPWDGGYPAAPEGVVAPPASASCPHREIPLSFVRREGDRLVDADGEHRFISFNIPNLHVLEDPVWHVPHPWEQSDALCSVVQAGGTVVRIYALSVGEGPDGERRHVIAPGVFDEELLVALDALLELAGRFGVRVIVPLVDQWSFWGGVGEYAAFRGLSPSAFWTDPTVRADFALTVEHVLTRVNTRTGVAYRDDPAILGWETGNELSSPPEWTEWIAGLLKSLDPRHLVIDGHSGIAEASLDNADVDVVSAHYYPGWVGQDLAAACARDRASTTGRRPLIVGEFGFAQADVLSAFMDEVVDDGTTGALLWSLRFHDVRGGFYWHAENEVEGVGYKAYHWPGFASGARHEEQETLSRLREAAFRIRAVPTPPWVPPDPPTVLAADRHGTIRWRGSAGATAYELWRADGADGPWQLVLSGFDDATQPSWASAADPDPPVRGAAHYRMTALNSAGASAPSATVPGDGAP